MNTLPKRIDDNSDMKTKCSYCGEKCGVIEETFDYSGTHCTHGNEGRHHTGVYVSDCCSETFYNWKGERIKNK